MRSIKQNCHHLSPSTHELRIYKYHVGRMMSVLETQSLQNFRNVSTLEITTVYPQKVYSEIIWKEIGPSEPEFLGQLSRKDVEQKDFCCTVWYFLVKRLYFWAPAAHYCVFFTWLSRLLMEKFISLIFVKTLSQLSEYQLLWEFACKAAIRALFTHSRLAFITSLRLSVHIQANLVPANTELTCVILINFFVFSEESEK